MLTPKRCLMVITLFLLVGTCSGCNTRIGWPWSYWEHGILPTIGCFGIGFMVFIGILFATCSFLNDSKPDQVAALLSGFGILVIASLLLQLLPHTITGIQIVPLPPWNYSGGMPWIISTAILACLVFGCCLAIRSNTRDHVQIVASAFIFASFCLNAGLSFWTVEADMPYLAARERITLMKSYEVKIGQLERLRTERTKAMETLSNDKNALVARIQGLEVRSKSELMAHPVGRTLADELVQLTNQIGRLRSETAVVESALERAKSALRSIEREETLKGLGVSGGKRLDELAQIDRELQEELRRVSGAPPADKDIHLDKLLDDVLATEPK
jgi:hypothetical protein